MNKVILMGRLSKDPELRYGQQQCSVTCSYTLAVNRSYKREGEPDADFIRCVAFGQRGEFAGKYFRKGMMVAVVGELRVSSFTGNDGTRRYSTDVMISEQYFAERKSESNQGFTPTNAAPPAQFVPEPVQASLDEDLPF